MIVREKQPLLRVGAVAERIHAVLLEHVGGTAAGRDSSAFRRPPQAISLLLVWAPFASVSAFVDFAG
jgi:hypothetical protein